MGEPFTQSDVDTVELRRNKDLNSLPPNVVTFWFKYILKNSVAYHIVAIINIHIQIAIIAFTCMSIHTVGQ